MRAHERVAEAAVQGAGRVSAKIQRLRECGLRQGLGDGRRRPSSGRRRPDQWNLWDGNLTRAQVSEARANLEAAQEQTRKLRLAVDLEVEQARLNLQEASERLAVTETAITQADESVQLTRARFEQGLTLATQLIDAETALTDAGAARKPADRRIAVAAPPRPGTPATGCSAHRSSLNRNP
jgi:outer membrane protein TolC